MRGLNRSVNSAGDAIQSADGSQSSADDSTGTALHSIENLDIIGNLCLLNQSNDKKMDFLGKGSGVLCENFSQLHSISQRRFQVTTFTFADLLRHPANRLILITQFAP